MEDLNVIRETVATLIGEANAEVAAWQKLEAKVRLLVESVAELDGAIDTCVAGIQQTAATAAAAVNLDAAAIEQGKAIVGTTMTSLRDLADRCAVMHDRLGPNGDVHEPISMLASTMEALQQTAGTHRSELQERYETFIESLQEGWASRLETVSDTVIEGATDLAETLDNELVEGIEGAFDDAGDELSELAETSCDRLSAVYESLEDSFEETIETTQEGLEKLGQEWTGRFEEMQQKYTSLGADLETLGKDVGEIYEMVMTSMQSSGIGMNSAASALSDLKGLLSGVS
jgi:archaellum component FlaC